jgi:hypothetical protein
MEYFWGSVKLMLVVYALGAVISFLVAWIIRLIFSGIKLQKARADRRNDAPAAAPLQAGNPEKRA